MRRARLLRIGICRSNPPEIDLHSLRPHAHRVLLLLAYLLAHPTSARCPAGYDLRTGIRRSGAFECWPVPIAPRGWSVASYGPITDWDGTWQRPERSVQPAGVLRGKIWCGWWTRPVVMDERSVACRRS